MTSSTGTTDAERWQQRLLGVQVLGRLPSVVAGVLQGGALTWVGTAGLPSTTPETAFRIGSITKTMTAVAVMQLREDGLLDLDDPLGRHLEGAPHGASTVRQLLSHTAGLPSEPAGSWWERSPGVDLATLYARNDGSRAVAPAGEWFHYSNLGYALLGALVESLRGEPWWDVVRERVLSPLGMERTTYGPEAQQDRHAQGYSVDHFAGTLTREPHTDTGAMAPAGQLWSTVGDLARWAVFLLDGAPGVLPAEVLAEMAHPVTPDALRGSSYGLGLQLVPLGRTHVGHGGSMPGFLASLFVDPTTRDGVVVLANATTGMVSGGVTVQITGPARAVPDAETPWRPTEHLPEVARELLGVWFWGNTAHAMSWVDGRLVLRGLATPVHLPGETFEVTEDGRVLGVEGYHRGETMVPHRRSDGTLSHLECATFVFTRTPYDPSVPVPGGHPAPA